jgi:NADH-quinone oxidoreductase subunit M
LAIQQTDLKKIIAYSSIAHMNLGVLGIFSGSLFGLHGGLFLFISHGLISGGLFFCIGVLYDRYHTRSLFYYGGLAQCMPIFSFIFMFFMFSNIAFPGTSGFVSEFLTLLGIFLEDQELGFIVGSASIILTLVYSITSATRVCFGPLKVVYFQYFVDLTYREFLVLLPLMFFILLAGFYADFILDYTYVSLLFLY